MKRISYDADLQQYLFRDSSGRLYQNAPGERYGPFTRVVIKSSDSTPLRGWEVGLDGLLLVPLVLMILLVVVNMVVVVWRSRRGRRGGGKVTDAKEFSKTARVAPPRRSSQSLVQVARRTSTKLIRATRKLARHIAAAYVRWRHQRRATRLIHRDDRMFKEPKGSIFKWRAVCKERSRDSTSMWVVHDKSPKQRSTPHLPPTPAFNKGPKSTEKSLIQSPRK